MAQVPTAAPAPSCADIAPHWHELLARSIEELSIYAPPDMRAEMKEDLTVGVGAQQLVSWCERWQFDPPMLACLANASSPTALSACELQFHTRRQDAGRPLPSSNAMQASCTELVQCRRSCAGGARLACHQIAVLQLQSDSREAFSDAILRLRRLCIVGMVQSCSLLADIEEKTAVMYPDDSPERRGILSLAAVHYARACLLGSGSACNNLGVMHAYGRGMVRDDRRAIELWRRACVLDEGLGCLNIGGRYMQGRGIARDPEQGMAFLTRGCRYGDGTSCELAGLQLGRTGDEKQARALFERGCELGAHKACDELKRMGTEVAVEQDVQETLRTLRTRCAAEEVVPCHRLAMHYLRGDILPRDLSKTREISERTCALGYPQSCELLGHLYFAGQGVARDVERAAELQARGCALGWLPSCTEHANMLRYGWGIPTDPVAAATLYQGACKKNWQPACRELGMMYFDGAGVAQDPKRGMSLLQESCAQDDGLSCTNVGVVYDNGLSPFPRDRTRALEYFERGCERDAAEGCLLAAKALMKLQGQEAQQRLLKVLEKGCSLGREELCPRPRQQAPVIAPTGPTPGT